MKHFECRSSLVNAIFEFLIQFHDFLLSTFRVTDVNQRDTQLFVLSDRELQVFHLIGQGITVREIAKKLSLSLKTVETYRENIKAKLELDNATELVRHAVQWFMEDS